MTTTRVTDNGGNTITFAELDGRMYPTFPEESIRHSTNIQARPDDILIATYAKAGTHWAFEIVRLLLAGTTDLPSVEKDAYMIEFADPTFIKDLPSPRNINSHFHHGVISADFIRQKSRIIQVTRDPRDIACSFFNHHRKLPEFYDYHGEWKDYFHLFVEGKLDYGSWFEYTKSWEACKKEHPEVPILVLSYEEMHQDSLKAIKQIDNFIGTNRSESFLKEVQDKTTFASMKRQREVTETKETNVLYGYRKGKVGDWKNWFTVAQSEMFNELFEKEMAGTDAHRLYSHAGHSLNDSNLNSE